MNRRPPRQRRRPPAGIALAALSALLAGAGIGLVVCGLQPVGPDRAPVARRPVATGIPSVRPPVSSPVPEVTATSAPPGPSATAGAAHELTVPGDGPSGDRAIQEVLEGSSRRNIPASLENRLTALGRKVWLAEVTGAGRGAWPAYFRGQHSSWLFTHVRVQAAIAREAGPDRATVQLVWAGTDPAGQQHEDQPATLRLVRIDDRWAPQLGQ